MDEMNRLTPFLYKLNIYSNPALNTGKNRQMLSIEIKKMASMDLSEEESQTYNLILQAYDSLSFDSLSEEGQLNEALAYPSCGKCLIKCVTNKKFSFVGSISGLFGKNKVIFGSISFGKGIKTGNNELDDQLIDGIAYEDKLVCKKEISLSNSPFLSSSFFDIHLPKIKIAEEDMIKVGDFTYNIHYLMAAYLDFAKLIDPFTNEKLKEEEKNKMCRIYNINRSDFDELWEIHGIVDKQLNRYQKLQIDTKQNNDMFDLEDNEEIVKEDVTRRIRTRRFMALIEQAKGASSHEYQALLEIIVKRYEYYETMLD